MTVQNPIPLPRGFAACGLSCGIKASKNFDLGLISTNTPARGFGLFTQNDVKAPPVLYCQQQLKKSPLVSHVLVNSGVANACTGKQGWDNVLKITGTLAKSMRAEAGVLMCSTGVIGEQLPMAKILKGLKSLKQPEHQGSLAFARAIMTTDTRPKMACKKLRLGGREVTLTGFSKGSGMIHPNMATMLAFILTDLQLPAAFSAPFRNLVDRSFNSISVDGDMSTNDSVILLGNGESGVRFASLSPGEQKKFVQAGLELFQDLARQVVRDGEGANKVIAIHIQNARSQKSAQALARKVANSPLVKTAFFGCDPNWGRILAALGSSDQNIDESKLKIILCGTPVFARGAPCAFREKQLRQKLQKPDVSLQVNVNQGSADWDFWTCDFSYDYVKINAEYHT